jgi:hypothetical protein
MLSSRRLQTSAGLLLALALSAGAAAAQSKKNRQVVQPEPPRPPTVQLDADMQVVTVCPDSESLAATQVRLKARASSPDGNPLRFRWTVSGGTVTGAGEDVVWDLTSAQPGTYVARVDVESGPVGDPTCNAFTTVPVIVRACPPPRPYCPNISIYCPDTVTAGQPITFTANVSGGTAGVTPTYRWTVTPGTITSGQDTTSITVDTSGLDGRAVTARVEVLGYQMDCSASCTAQVPQRRLPKTHDEFGNIPRDDEKARLDTFAIQLQNEPGARGYIVVYPGPKSRANEAQRRADRAKEYLVGTRGMDPGRVVTVVGPPRAAFAVQLWIVPAGADPPEIR